jgi:hypothetical protein
VRKLNTLFTLLDEIGAILEYIVAGSSVRAT